MIKVEDKSSKISSDISNVVNAVENERYGSTVCLEMKLQMHTKKIMVPLIAIPTKLIGRFSDVMEAFMAEILFHKVPLLYKAGYKIV